MINQRLSQKMLQKLSPQQIQLMKLLQIPTATLEQRIKEELEANPALDEGDEEVEEELSVYDNNPTEEVQETEKDDYEEDDSILIEDEFESYLNDYMDDEDNSDYSNYNTDSYNPEEENKTIPVAIENTFHDHLKRQIGLLNILEEKENKIALQIVGSIDDDGYLRRDPASIIDDLLFGQNIECTEDEILYVLHKIQSFDPPGVGARNLQECLLLQIAAKQKMTTSKKQLKLFNQAAFILENCFDEFTKKHYQKLQRQLNISEVDLKEIHDEILKLNPKPASGYVDQLPNRVNANQYIVPDFIIVNREGELELSLNSRNAPDLRINDHYMEMLKSYRDNKAAGRVGKKEKDAILFIKQKIDSAKWFIDAIKQRQDTLYRTMYSIMQFQYEFFLTGDQKKLRPMILKDIAEITSLDISTVSRVANSKFVQTEFGTKRLKDFFSESIQNEEGDEVSTLEVKKILSDYIKAEDKRKPLSDEKLKELLFEKGYNIARRTIAKYREQLNIPVARLRKEL